MSKRSYHGATSQNGVTIHQRPDLLGSHCSTGDIFQHDNARPHTAQVCQDFLQQNNIHVLPWPARSADLSPTEYLWDIKGTLRHTHYRNISWLYRMNGNLSPNTPFKIKFFQYFVTTIVLIFIYLLLLSYANNQYNFFGPCN